jgi:hypothetical protein
MTTKDLPDKFQVPRKRFESTWERAREKKIVERRTEDLAKMIIKEKQDEEAKASS